MLPKKHRLTFPQFQKNRQKANFLRTPLISIYSKKTTSQYTRFVIIVPKSVDKRSVRRHRIKRVIAEYIYTKISNTKEPCDVLIRVNRNSEDNLLIDSIDHLLQKTYLTY